MGAVVLLVCLLVVMGLHWALALYVPKVVGAVNAIDEVSSTLEAREPTSSARDEAAVHKDATVESREPTSSARVVGAVEVSSTTTRDPREPTSSVRDVADVAAPRLDDDATASLVSRAKTPFEMEVLARLTGGASAIEGWLEKKPR